MDPSDGALLSHIDSMWEAFGLSGEAKYLAAYLELGGEIDAQVRASLVTFLREGPPNRRGGRDNLRDVETYSAIESIRFEKTWETLSVLHNAGWFAESGKAEEKKELPPLPETMTLVEARGIFIKRSGRAMADDTVRKRYERGRDILSSGRGK